MMASTKPAATQAPIAAFEAVSMDTDDLSDIGTKTDWKMVRIAGFIWLLSAIENTVIGMSEWPYMKQIDPAATTQFFGYVQSTAKAGHAIFALIFSYWSYKISKCKTPLLVGRYLALAGCVLYLFVEFLPANRRFLMLCCYFLFGIGYSSTTVLRGYIAAVSALKDRSRAYAVSTLAHLMAIIIGPVIQLAFAHLKYPGIDLIPEKLRIHIYSAPIWFALITNIAAILLVQFAFKEAPLIQKQKKENPKSFVSKTISFMRSAKVKWSLVFLCWGEKMASHLSIITLMTVATPYFMLAFNWTGQMTVLISSLSHIFVGLLSIALSAMYVFGKLGHYVSARLSFIIGLTISMFLYISTYPWPNISVPFSPYNATTQTGCNSQEYDWCETGKYMPAPIWIFFVVVVMGVGIPFCIISIDTIYSKILGNIDQNVMQGAYVFVEDVFMVAMPICVAFVFSKYGQSVLWVMNGLFTAVALLIWVVCYPMLEKYK